MPATAEPTPILPGLSSVCSKPIVACFDGALMSSNAGLLALREVELRLGMHAASPPASATHPPGRTMQLQDMPAGWQRA